MDMLGERLIKAPREKVWAALNDPEILKACIPGCEAIEKLSDSEMTATATVKLGPISARFVGKVLLSDLDPPKGCTISGEGQGGEAGFANGDAKVALQEEGAETRLSYKVNAQIGGKMAQLGTRVIDLAAKQYADTFLDRFVAIVAPPAAIVASTSAEAIAETSTTAPVLHIAHEDHDHDPSNPHYFGLPVGVIIAGAIAVIAVGITMAKFFL